MNRPEPLSISEIVKKLVTAKFDDKIFGPFYCKVCSFDGTSSEDSTTHLKSRDHALRVRTLASSKTLVWWDINRCPVPEGCDPRLVVPIIKGELEKSGFSGGPLTITAIGDLKHTLKQTPDVLPAISSSGILLKHDDEQCLMTEMFNWIRHNPPPATIMFITGNVKLVLYTGLLQDKGYTVFLYPAWVHLMPFQINLTTKFWLSETGESAWCCLLCRSCHEIFDGESFDGESFDGELFDSKRFEDFTMHLESRGHALALALSGLPPLISKKQSSCLHPNDPTTMVCTPVISNMQSSCLHPNDATTVPEFQKQAIWLVWWDVNSCPLPHGYDARLVVPTIELAVKKACPSSERLIIAVVGNRKDTPGVFQAIDSSSILLNLNIGGLGVGRALLEWTSQHPFPRTIMLISSDWRSYSVCGLLQDEGYTIIPYPSLVNLLIGGDADAMASGSADNKQETRRLVLQGKCSEMVEFALP